MHLVVGLGNPGRAYASHRHNVGFMAVDDLADWRGADPFRLKFAGELSRLRVDGDELLLLKPQTYMNESGRSVGPAAGFFRISADRIIVVHDELDLPPGTIRIKRGGGHAGHNGLRSIISAVGSAEFVRIRIGVGHPPAGFRGETADYVLGGFGSELEQPLPTILRAAAETVLDIATRGVEAAMKTKNRKLSKKRPDSPGEPAPGDRKPSRGAGRPES